MQWPNWDSVQIMQTVQIRSCSDLVKQGDYADQCFGLQASFSVESKSLVISSPSTSVAEFPAHPLRFSVCHDAPVPKYSPRDFYSCHAVLVLVQTWKPWQDCANCLTRVGPTLRLWRSNHADNLDSIQLLAVLQGMSSWYRDTVTQSTSGAKMWPPQQEHLLWSTQQEF